MRINPSHLVDPTTGEPLRIDGDRLHSSTGSYPIVDGIPRFVPTSNYASNFGLQWKRFRETQLDSFTGAPMSADRLERCLGEPLETLRGKRVLEAGSGAGRFTEILLAHGAILDSFDYSTAVEANALNHPDQDFTLVQADVRHMPFEKRAYDVVICLGVVQHTPDSEQTIACLFDMVKPGGKLVIDHYAKMAGSLPWPLGSANPLWRRRFLALPDERRYEAVKAHVDRWFPLYWKTRHTKWGQRILGRIAGLNFYFPGMPFTDRETHYRWSLLDSHDALTDVFKRRRTVPQIAKTLGALDGAVEINAWRGGNGVEAHCRRAR